jgi:hypothetical protein
MFLILNKFETWTFFQKTERFSNLDNLEFWMNFQKIDKERKPVLQRERTKNNSDSAWASWRWRGSGGFQPIKIFFGRRVEIGR